MMDLSDLIKPEAVIGTLKANSKKQATPQLTSCASRPSRTGADRSTSPAATAALTTWPTSSTCASSTRASCYV